MKRDVLIVTAVRAQTEPQPLCSLEASAVSDVIDDQLAGSVCMIR